MDAERAVVIAGGGPTGLMLAGELTPTFTSPAADHIDLLRTAWPILARAESDPVFALFFEAGGLAAAGREPYSTLVPQLVDRWIAWAGDFIRGTPARRRTEAAAAIAVLDGLLLLRQLASSPAPRSLIAPPEGSASSVPPARGRRAPRRLRRSLLVARAWTGSRSLARPPRPCVSCRHQRGPPDGGMTQKPVGAPVRPVRGRSRP